METAKLQEETSDYFLANPSSEVVTVERLPQSLLVLGDSHARAFKYIAEKKLLGNTSIDYAIVPGATAQGMCNPNSKTNALNIFTDLIDSISLPYSLVLTHLGEVDCGFVIWYRAEKYNESVESQIDRSITNYENLIHRLKEKDNKHICIAGPVLPTIPDGCDWAGVAQARKEVTATQLERTMLTLEYNSRLRDMAGRNSVNYIDITDDILDNNTGLVSTEFLSESPHDHHLSDQKSSLLWTRKLEKLLRKA